MKAPLVSIIVLLYKKFDDIYFTLNSIFNQEYPNIEIIISDDGSPNYFEFDSKIKQYLQFNKKLNIKRAELFHNEENVGTTKNCNYALSLVKGKYVSFLSPGDTFYDENVVKKCVLFCEKNKAEILVGQTFMLRKNGNEIDTVRDTILYRFKARGGRRCILVPTTHDITYLMSLKKEKCNKILSSRPVISTVSVFFSKELLDRTQGFPDYYRLIEDMPYWPYLAKKGVKFYFYPIKMKRYSLGGISNGGEGNEEFRKDCAEILETMYIPNEYRGGILKSLLKKIRLRELEYLYKRKSGSLEYLDVLIYHFFIDLKYLFLGTRL